MSAQVCPHCKACSFVWSLDEDVSPLTKWHCVTCKYTVKEDEAQERTCAHCGTERSSLLLRDAAGIHRWCCTCGIFEETMEPFVTCDA
jgi:hypothetical protein